MSLSTPIIYQYLSDNNLAQASILLERFAGNRAPLTPHLARPLLIFKRQIDIKNYQEAIKIDPQKLIQSNEFNKEFFKKIDEIENSILNGFNIDQIKNKYNFATINKNNYASKNEEDEILNEIYLKRNQEKIQLIDKNDYYLLYEIKKINKILPDKNNTEFIEQVSKKLYLKEKDLLNLSY